MARRKTENSFLLILSVAALLLIGFVLFTTLGKNEQVAVAPGCNLQDLSGVWQEGETLAIFEGGEVAVPSKLPSFLAQGQEVLGTATPSERWIEVDLSEQKLRAWEGSSLFLETPVSTGLPWWPTPTGEFRIWIKLRATKMEGGQGKYYYNLPNVPYVMYFSNSQVPSYKGYGLHGTYWHNDFGTPRSHGCVNLPTPVAEQLYHWTSPSLDGKGVVYADATNQGTRIVIHD